MDMKQFLGLVIRRGYGIYGRETMEKMTKRAGISKNAASISVVGDVHRAAEKFFAAYCEVTPIAAMNLKMMAKMYNMKL